MTMDSNAIHALLARYGRLIDQRRAEEWSELFVPDGCLQVAGQAPIEGRAALREFAANSPVGTHITGIPELRVDAGRVLASASWIFVPQGRSEIRAGLYHDEIRLPSGVSDALFVRRDIEFLPSGKR
ncbi:nuclear transport factor 2 family protein [Nocardia miyunensis]|uniref:nuclear transport factor 2 family protein n=1 Tax=Nocardia miyunensis TaxID=282684 RepID=UPI0008364934|nr:nuclear transport factor 2 family protein [Nocardia miyunensis]